MKIVHDKLKVHSLTGRITEEMMHKAFKAVKKNRGAAGIDKVSIEMYKSNLNENLPSLNECTQERNLSTDSSEESIYPKREEETPSFRNTYRKM